jgi:HAMP domain-containing protein
MVQPAVEQDKIIGHYLRRIARLEKALRRLHSMMNQYDNGDLIKIVEDALAEEFSLDG